MTQQGQEYNLYVDPDGEWAWLVPIIVGAIKGALTENFVIQELILTKKNLAYWTSSGTAEVDIVCDCKGYNFSLEIKSYLAFLVETLKKIIT